MWNAITAIQASGEDAAKHAAVIIQAASEHEGLRRLILDQIPQLRYIEHGREESQAVASVRKALMRPADEELLSQINPPTSASTSYQPGLAESIWRAAAKSTTTGNDRLRDTVEQMSRLLARLDHISDPQTGTMSDAMPLGPGTRRSPSVHSDGKDQDMFSRTLDFLGHIRQLKAFEQACKAAAAVTGTQNSAIVVEYNSCISLLKSYLGQFSA